MRSLVSLRTRAQSVAVSDAFISLQSCHRPITTPAAKPAAGAHLREQTKATDKVVDSTKDQRHHSKGRGVAGVRNRGGPYRRQAQAWNTSGKSGLNLPESSAPVLFPLGNGLEVTLPHDAFAWKTRGAPAGIAERNQSAGEHGGKFVGDGGKSLQVCDSNGCGTDRQAEVAIMHLNESGELISAIFAVPSLKGSKKLQKALEEWPELLHRLRADSLPVILGSSGESPPTARSIIRAFQILTEALGSLDSISQNSGLRAEQLFPADLVAALWRALPPMHEYIKRTAVDSPQPSGGTDSDNGVNESLRDDEVALPATPELPSSPMKAFKVARRALALRAREVGDVLPPSLLVQVLLSIEKCGALSDDIIGPMGTRLLERYDRALVAHGGPQRVASNHQLSTRFVSRTMNSYDLPFSDEDSVSFARLLGRAQVVDHFQLHRLVHTILLPSVVRALRSNALSLTELFELTACYARYAVCGRPVVQVTELWMSHVPQMSLEQCVKLLNIVSPNRQRINGKKRFTSGKTRQTLATGAEEDYFPLVGAVLERAVWLCVRETQIVNNTDTTEQIIAVADEDCGVLSPTCLTKFMCALTRVNAERWAEVYMVVASVIEKKLELFSITDVMSMAKSIIQRGSNIPYHTFHAQLARFLLQAKAALSDVKVASVALVSAALMLPAPPLSLSKVKEVHFLQPPTNSVPAPTCAGEDKPLREMGSCTLEHSSALAIFRKHGTRLGLHSFVAGMCATPLEELPRRSQERVIVHFTAIASAIGVAWLARGIAALTSRIPDSVDPLSVQRWFSRFTVVDVTRQLDLEHAAMLLNVLSHENYSRESALAKRAITNRVARLLLQDDVSLHSIVLIAPALQRADVFFPHLYSRLCRVLLSTVQKAPFDALLPAFYVAADEFTRCKHHNGGTFRDVWELLRTRVIDDAAVSLTTEDVIVALNGFAALDVGDYPVFSVLLHRLWVSYKEVASQCGGEEGGTSAVSGSLTPTRWVDKVLSGCTPSAVAVLACSLTHLGDGEVVDTFMPWVLLRLRQVVRDIFPIDVLHLMPALLTNFAKAASRAENSLNPTHWLNIDANCSLLHAVYDACRELFLQMYGEARKDSGEGVDGVRREDWIPKVHVSVSSVPHRHFAELLIALCRAGVQDETVVMACAPRTTQRCCAVLPMAELVDLTMALCFHLHLHPQETDQCDTSKEQSIKHTDGTDGDVVGNLPFAESEGTGNGGTDAVKSASLQAITPNQQLLLPALNALWERVEELSLPQVDALVRCLRHYYGEKVDTDFLFRLQNHRAAVEEMRRSRQQRRGEKVMKGEATLTVDAAKPRNSAEEQGRREEGTQLQLTAEDLFVC